MEDPTTRTIELPPAKWLSMTIGWDAELRGVFATLCLRLLYEGRGMADDDAVASKLCGCSLRKWRELKSALLGIQAIKIRDGFIEVEWCMAAILAAKSRTIRRSVNASARQLIFGESGGECFYCGSEIDIAEFHVEHKIPVSKGGDNSPDNLVAACIACNLSKGAKLLSEWRP